MQQRPSSAAAGGIGRSGEVQVEVDSRRTGGVAVVIGGVGLAAGGGELRAAGRLGVLPGGQVWSSGGSDGWRCKGAAVGGWAGVLIDEEGDGVEVLFSDELADVLRCGDGDAGRVGDGLATEVEAGLVGRGGDGLGPGEEIGRLFGEKAASFLLIEEEDGTGGEAFATGCGDGGLSVGVAEGFGRCSTEPGVEEVGVEATVEEDEEAEAVAEQDLALALPGVGGFAGRVVEPVAGEVEALSQGGKGGVAGVEIAVEAEVAGGACLRGCRCNEGDEAESGDEGRAHSGFFQEYRMGCASFFIRTWGERRIRMSVTVEDPRYPIGRFEQPETITPEERLNAIATLAELPEELRNAVEGLNSAQLNTPYREGGWTVRQLVHHIADSHINAYVRMRLALTEDWPTIKPYDEQAWATLHDSAAPVEWSLTLIESLHARWVMMLQSLTDEQWLRGYRHPESGDTSVEAATLMYAWHSRHHVAHITHLRTREDW